MNESLILGCGNLGNIILDGFSKKGKKVIVFEKNKTIKKNLKKKDVLTVNNLKDVKWERIEYVMICVKPIDSIGLLNQLKENILPNCSVISFVAGLKIKKIKSLLIQNINVFRFMPNILIEVGESATGIFTDLVDEKKKINLIKDFSFFGYLKWLSKEDEMDLFTSLYGGGPAYIFYFLECLVKISEKSGLDSEASRKLVISLLNGTSKLIKKDNQDFSSIVDKVTSKGGTTEKAINFFEEDQKFFKIISEGILRAKNRSMEISKKLD